MPSSSHLSMKDLWYRSLKKLQESQLTSPEVPLKLFFSALFNKTPAEVFLSDDFEINPDSLEKLDYWIDRRIEGEPTQYIVGSSEFRSLDLQVGPGVLIPRPETELIIDLVKMLLNDYDFENISGLNSVQNLKVSQEQGDLHGAEFGLGSGAISLSLISEIPSLKMSGSEISEAARVWLYKNKEKLDLSDHLRIYECSGFSGFESNLRFDFIVANPPYIPRGASVDPRVLKYEPEIAYYVESEDSLAPYRQILEEGLSHLKLNSFILMEGYPDLLQELSEVIEKEMKNSISEIDHSGDIIIESKIIKDLTGADRFVLVRRKISKV